MQATEPDKDDRPRAHPSWWKRVVLGALGGALFGAMNIWFYEVSLVRLVAASIAGASFCAIFGLFAPKLAQDRSKLIALAGFAGIAAGIAYWVVARPSASLIFAVIVGFVSGIVYAWAELRGQGRQAMG
jgi:hypothetical protein